MAKPIECYNCSHCNVCRFWYDARQVLYHVPAHMETRSAFVAMAKSIAEMCNEYTE